MDKVKEIFQTFSRMRVLVVGDVMIDRYLRGRVDRISPEAPVPVLAFQHSESRLGGAANVALNIHALGAEPILCSLIGKDENADVFRSLLPEAGLSARGILASDERQTTVKTRVMAGSQHLLRVDREDTHLLSAQEEAQFLHHLRQLLQDEEVHAILFQDYNKGVLSPGLIAELVHLANARGIPTAVDPKKEQFFDYRGVTLFKPNLKEIRDSLPFAVEPEQSSLLKAARYLRERLQHRISLITLSEKGLFIESEQKNELHPTLPRNITDVCGAGDSVISVTTLALAAGLSLGHIARLANLAGGQVCEKVGVTPVDREMLMQELQVFYEKN